MEDVLKSLKVIEKQLRENLEKLPLYKQWDSVCVAISNFENPNNYSKDTKIGVVVKSVINRKPLNIPFAYSDELTWRDKMLFALNDTVEGSIKDIKNVLLKNGSTDSEDAIEKRVSTTASAMKREGILDAKYEGKKAKYFITNHHVKDA